MITRRVLTAIAAAASIAAAAASVVVALAFTLYAATRETLGPAGASACVAGAAALLAVIAAFVASQQMPHFKGAKGGRAARNAPALSPMDRIIGVARERPLLAAAAAAAAGFIAFRNPLLVATIVRAMTEPVRRRD